MAVFGVVANGLARRLRNDKDAIGEAGRSRRGAVWCGSTRQEWRSGQGQEREDKAGHGGPVTEVRVRQGTAWSGWALHTFNVKMENRMELLAIGVALGSVLGAGLAIIFRSKENPEELKDWPQLLAEQEGHIADLRAYSEHNIAVTNLTHRPKTVTQ